MEWNLVGTQNNAKRKFIAIEGRIIFLSVVAILTIFCVASWMAQKSYLNAVSHMAYIGYVMHYLPEKKALTGQWPSNLNELPAHIEKEIDSESAPYVKQRLEMVLEYHLSNYKGLQILSSDERSCSFNLQTGNESINLKSEVKRQ